MGGKISWAQEWLFRYFAFGSESVYGLVFAASSHWCKIGKLRLISCLASVHQSGAVAWLNGSSARTACVHLAPGWFWYPSLFLDFTFHDASAQNCRVQLDFPDDRNQFLPCIVLERRTKDDTLDRK